MAAPLVRPKYGLFGSVGPAPRFTWAEVRSRDGYLPSLPGLRSNIVTQAMNLNYLRKAVAKRYNRPIGSVFITVNSWVRSEAHNAKVGGEPHSYHTRRADYWSNKAGYLNWHGFKYKWRKNVKKGCVATDIQVFVKDARGRVVKLTPQTVRDIAVANVAAFRNGGRGVYPRLGFTHLDHRGYPAEWRGAS